jgi:2-amino-4-hydroxy-6-hydroxymethyldihydropteridine diphosphokinase
MNTKHDDRWKNSSTCGKKGFLAYLLLGGNLGDVAKTFNRAIELLDEDTTVIRQSALYKSEPWGFQTKHLFLNQVLEIRTNLSPQELLNIALETEKTLGRIRSADGGYTSRSIDIDILFYEDIKIDTPELTLPHPRMHERKFALMPMVELANNFVHPMLNQSMDALLKLTPDQSSVWKM